MGAECSQAVDDHHETRPSEPASGWGHFAANAKEHHQGLHVLRSTGSREAQRPSYDATFHTDIHHDEGFCREVLLAVCVTMPERKGADPAWLHEEAPRVDGEASFIFSHPPAHKLLVPSKFHELRYDWTVPTQKQRAPNSFEEDRLQACLKLFVDSMLAGVAAQLRLEAGEAEGSFRSTSSQSIAAVLRLNQDLSAMVIAAAGSERRVPICAIRWVRPPETSNGLAWFLPSERDLMVVLSLAGGRFVRVRFGEKEQAGYFGTCMRLLVKVARLEAQEEPHSRR